MAELADAADSKSADLRVLGVRLPLPAPARTPQNKQLAGASSPHETHSTADRADLTPHLATRAESTMLKTWGLVKNGKSEHGFQICYIFQVLRHVSERYPFGVGRSDGGL